MNSEDQIRDALRSLRDEPLPADSLARVRLSVARRTTPAPIPWRIAAVFAVLALIALLIAVRVPEAETLTLTAQAPAAPALSVPVVRKTVRPIPPRLPVAAPSGTIRLETEDPEVVIYLIGD